MNLMTMSKDKNDKSKTTTATKTTITCKHNSHSTKIMINNKVFVLWVLFLGIVSNLVHHDVVVVVDAHKIDLSYLPHVKSSIIANALSESLKNNDNNNKNDPLLLDIDISCSSMCGTGIKNIVKALQDVTTKSKVSLQLQRNQMSPIDATVLIEAILLANDNETMTQNKTSIDNDDTSSITTQDVQSTTLTVDSDENDKNTTTTTTTNKEIIDATSSTVPSSLLLLSNIVNLDISWNDLSPESTGSKTFLSVLRKLISNPILCPKVLRFDVCGFGPATCRALGKGLIQRFEQQQTMNNETVQPLSLHLSRNEAIGDAGVAALCAAIRTINANNNNNKKNNDNDDFIIFDTLNLSACGIGDTGAEAIAVALESGSSCIRHLDLSSNAISNKGAIALGRALGYSTSRNGLQSLNLSNNKDIGDSGATEIANAIDKGKIQNLSMRSCSIYADGAASFGKIIKSLAFTTTTSSNKSKKTTASDIDIDLSGNPLGILRGKVKSSSGNKYSATKLKSRASATTAAYMNIIGKSIQKGLNEIGVGSSSSSSTLESDDDGDDNDDNEDDNDGNETKEESKLQCGALAFADAILLLKDDDDHDNGQNENDKITKNTSSSSSHRVKHKRIIKLGLRRCGLDTRAAEALAAVIVHLQDNSSSIFELTIDATMNNVLEEEMIEALDNVNNNNDNEYLHDMADRYTEVMEVLHEAKRRATQAARAAAFRSQAEAQYEAAWGNPVDMDDNNNDSWDEEWDSDADYEAQDDYDGYDPY